MSKFLMKVLQVETGEDWEEEMTMIFVDENSPHYNTHEIGWHTAPTDLTIEQARHYAENIVTNFNRSRRPKESVRELLGVRGESSE